MTRSVRRFLETVSVGPLPFFFCNTNTTMRLQGHCHHAFLTVVYRTTGGDVGYPSFQATNDALRTRLQSVTGVEHRFADATNEEVLRRLWNALDGWTDPTWERWDGSYTLHGLHMDVLSVNDRIGHDAGSTRYSLQALPPGGDQ